MICTHVRNAEDCLLFILLPQYRGEILGASLRPETGRRARRQSGCNYRLFRFYKSR